MSHPIDSPPDLMPPKSAPATIGGRRGRRLFTALAVLLTAAPVVLCPPAADARPAAGGLFDVEARRAALAEPRNAPVRASCLAVEADPSWAGMAPIPALRSTEGYGTDRAANDYAWAVMVLAGRALAADAASEKALRDLLLSWSAAKAFDGTEVENDAYYALKRVLLPTIVAYTILQPRLSPAQRAQITGWIDPLARRIDHKFRGVVDVNNHRYLADSVLMAWGSVVDDPALVAKGRERFVQVLHEARPDGSIPLETRRGSRALWYMRQSLASLTVMAEVAAVRGENLFGRREDGVNLDRILSFFLDGVAEPGVVLAYAAENYIPGPHADYREQDLGFLEKRGHGRHYMAWAEAWLARARPGTASNRLDALMRTKILTERPLIDEFVGGNATCFWGRP